MPRVVVNPGQSRVMGLYLTIAISVTWGCFRTKGVMGASMVKEYGAYSEASMDREC